MKFKKSYMIVALTFLIRRFIVGCRIWQITVSNLERKIKNPFIHGKWMKRTSKWKGKWHYLYRAIDADGLTLDIWLRKKTDTQAAMLF